MAEGMVDIHCPHCGHPYPMTRLQADVFSGRNMGCMACGRPFKVIVPEPAPEPQPIGASADPIEDQTSAPAASAAAAAAPHHDPSPLPQARTADLPGKIAVALALAALLAMTIGVLVAYSASTPGMAHAAATPRGALTAIHTIAPLLAAAAVVLGLFCLIRAARHRQSEAVTRRPRTGLATAAVACGAAQLVLLGLLTTLTWPSLAKGLDASRRVACMDQLQQIGHAALAFASGHPQRQFPDSLADLTRQNLLPEAATACPGGEAYRYHGQGVTLSAAGGDPLLVLALEPVGHHGDEGGHVLFGDGLVIYVDAAIATSIARELEQRQNPPPTASILRQ